MRLNDNKKIINEDDIILSDGSSTLSERINSQQQQINQLKSNVKWIYKYGGVGSGGGGGGTSIPFSIYATLDDVQLKSQTLVLAKQDIYPLYIKINNPNNWFYSSSHWFGYPWFTHYWQLVIYEG